MPVDARRFLQHADAGWEEIPIAETPLVMIDTTGCDMFEAEEQLDNGSGFASSKYNEGEAKLVLEHVQRLLQHGVGSHVHGVLAHCPTS